MLYGTTNQSTAGQLYCPLLQLMQQHSLNNSKEANWAVVCFHGLISGLGILENALILWVVGFRLQRRTVASVWVLNLALSDFLATLTLPLFTIYLSSSHSWELGYPLCKIQASIFFLNMFVSAFLLAAISLDRCLLVVKPVWCQNHRSVAGAWKVCAVAWLWALINMFPYFLFRAVTKTEDNRKLCYHNFALYVSSEASLETDCEVRQTATAVSKLLLAFLLPLVVIAGSYIQICLGLRSRRKKRAASIMTKAETASSKMISIFRKPPTTNSPSSLTPTSSAPSQLSQSFTKMVAFVIAAFVLCWAPYHIFCMIEVLAQYHKHSFKIVVGGLPFATTVAFLNPVLNPILYAFSCPDFCVRVRQSLGAVFDGLVEERGPILLKPGKSKHIRRRSSRDASPATATFPRCPHSPHPSLNAQLVLEPCFSDSTHERKEESHGQPDTENVHL
ncbi:prostaglandin D2 receptor 2-like isoform X1 [Synchiropus splendidus]|uniref:prostaglandin D2 receptor 2-like isoform X1 n=1 Tax=Synchiropus splendidus TaxID=270530 RepID=UPI00237E012E|nr:prostaglandin D2 receptor 2-like isoform X1 [Synchiropus splendidus]